MRILMINQYYPPDCAPTGFHLEGLCQALTARGHRVRVLCSRGKYINLSAGFELRGNEAIEVVRMRASGLGRSSSIGRILDYLSYYILATLRALFGPRPDVVVCLTTPPLIGILAWMMRVFRGVPYAHWVMDLYPDAMVAHRMIRSDGLICRVLEWLTRRTLRRADTIWALGPFARDRIARYLRPGQEEKIEVVPVWADASLKPWNGRKNPMREAYDCNGHFVVMYSGNMGLGHEFDTFLEGAQALQESNVKFLFVGGGTREAEVRAKTAARALTNVEFRHYARREDLRASLSAGDVHIVSQRPAWQGCIVPSKIMGIFAVGRPTIFVGDRQNEIAYWIARSETGFVVPPGDRDGLVQAIERLRNDNALRERMGRNARVFYEQNLSQEILIPQLVASVERTASKGRRGAVVADVEAVEGAAELEIAAGARQ